MSDPGPFGQDPDPTEVFPPLRPDPPTPPATLPPVGSERDPDPTRVMQPGDPAAVPPPGGPYEPGPPYGGGGGGGGGGGEPPFEPEPEPWYRQPGPLAALIAGVAALILALIALLIWVNGGDDDSSDNTLPTVASTVPTTTPPSSTTATTEPATTTSSSTTTSTSTTTTSTTTTTLPPTTTTTTTPPTTAAPTTTTTTPITNPPIAKTAWDYVMANPDRFSEFQQAVDGSPYEQLFTASGLYTFLIPDNDAFPNTGEVDWNDYVTAGALTANQILSDGPLTMSSGKSLAVENGKIGGATIVTKDQSVGNGLIQVIDAFVKTQP